MSESNTQTIESPNGGTKKVAFPIISIYFLGHPHEHATAPVIKANRTYTDVATGKVIVNKEEFIESLTHDSYVIQIPKLKGKRRTDLEILLSIFDQSQKQDSNHILNVNEEEFPKEFRNIIRKLQRAILDDKIQKTMDVEDEILAELENKERTIAKKDKVIEEKDKTIEKKDKLLDKQGKALSEKDKLLEEQLKQIEELKKRLGDQ